MDQLQVQLLPLLKALGKFTKTSLRTALPVSHNVVSELEAKVRKKQANAKWVLLRPVVLNKPEGDLMTSPGAAHPGVTKCNL